MRGCAVGLNGHERVYREEASVSVIDRYSDDEIIPEVKGGRIG
jgi:hypothetical protein